MPHNISRRQILATSAAAAVALGLGSRPIRAQGRVVVRIGSVFRIGSIVPDAQLEFQKLLTEHSKGEFDPKFYPSESLGDATARNAMLQAGTLEVSNTSAENIAPYVPLFNALLFPYVTGGQNGDPKQCILNGIKISEKKEFADAVTKASNAKGIVFGFWTPLGMREYCTTARVNRVTKSPEDFKGVKVRVAGSVVESRLFQMLGANPVPLPGPEIITSLESGVADAAHLDAVSIDTQGFYKPMNRITRTLFYPVFNLYVASKLWYDRLPPRLQTAFTQACRDASEVQRSQFIKADQEAFEFIKKQKIDVYLPASAEFAKLYEAVNYKRKEWEPVIKQLIGDVETFNRLVAI
jgi:TRAP-type transport system periplasmic protein